MSYQATPFPLLPPSPVPGGPPAIPPPSFAQPPPPQLPGVPPAVAARQRKDQKRDTQRKIGSKVMQGDVSGLPGALQRPATTGYMPSPPPPQPQNTSADQVPQYVTPQLQQPQYQGPKKGLEYLALGLGLLFPGAPIGRLAAGFAGGLNQGAQQKYQRQEQQATEQNQQARDTAQANFENAKMQYEAAQQLRNQGIDPKTNKPFILPPPLQQPPKNATAQQLFQWYGQRAQFYTSVGAGELATQNTQAAQDYQRQMVQDATIAAQWQRDLFNQHEQDQRDQFNQNSQNAREGSREAAEDAREDRREAAEDARQDRREAAANYQKLPELRDKASQASKEFYTEYSKAIKVPVDANGNPKTDADGKPLTAAIPPQLQAALGKIFSLIDRSSDPEGAAEHYIQTLPPSLSAEQSAAVKGLLEQRGEAGGLKRRSQGLPIIPVRYAPIQKAATGPKYPNPPGMPQGAKYVGHGPSGGDLYQLPDGSQHEYTGP